MSYFLFGTATTTQKGFFKHAQQFGIVLKAVEAGVIQEMLLLRSEVSEASSFLIVMQPDDDTSEAVISPFQVPRDSICRNLAAIQEWLESVVSYGIRVRIYITEGYDVAFEELSITASEFSRRLGDILARDGDWPSLQIDIR